MLLDPDDPEKEDRERRAVEDAALPPIVKALASAEDQLNELLRDGRLPPAELQALLVRYRNNFGETLAEALRRVARNERSEELQQQHRYAISRTVDTAAAAGLDVAFGQLGNMGISLNYDLLHRFARDWAQGYSYNLITRIDESTGRQVGNAVTQWIESGEHLDHLIRALQPTFGRNRSEMIAATETTRAFAEGTLLGYRQSGQVEGTEWRTAMDERVCPICRPLHGQRGDLNGNVRHPGGIGKAGRYGGMLFRYPAHVRCRCTPAPVLGELKIFPVAGLPTVVPAPATTAPSLIYKPSDEQLVKVNKVVDTAIQRTARNYEVDPDEVERVVAATLDELIRDKPLAIQVPDERFDQLLESGRFKTQFETKSSSAIYRPEYRSAAENKGIGTPLDLDPTERPIYGYVNVDKEARVAAEEFNYGTLTFVLKDEVRQRSTLTVGDSLNNFDSNRQAASPAMAPGREAWDGQVPYLYEYAQDKNTKKLLGEIGYIEAQIQGQVTLADVATVLDPHGKLTAAQRAQLDALGIVVKKE